MPIILFYESFYLFIFEHERGFKEEVHKNSSQQHHKNQEVIKMKQKIFFEFYDGIVKKSRIINFTSNAHK